MMLRAALPNGFHQLTAPCSVVKWSPDHNTKEQELAQLLHQSRGFEQFRQIHGGYVKLGRDRTTEHASGLLRACCLSDWGSIGYARKVFDQILDPGTYEFTILIRGYATRSSDPVNAVFLYSEMLDIGITPNNFTLPFVIKACARIGGVREGMQIHGHAFKFGLQSDVFVQNSLISMYANFNEIEKSMAIFEQLGDYKNASTWSSLISAYTRLGMWDECLKVYGRMMAEGWRTDESVLVGVLSSSTNLGALAFGMCSHCALLRNTQELNVIMQTSLIDMYVKCGKLDSGMRIFRSMARRNLYTYSVMISGLAMHGEGEKALGLFTDMIEEGHEPDEAVFVAVLTACSHAGLFAEGLRVFDRMRFEHRMEPNILHYGCMVDLMCRAGKIKKAYEFIKYMPMEADESIWRTLLNACRVHQCFELVDVASQSLLELDDRKGGDYVLVSNIYSMAGRYDEAARIRARMVDEGFSQTMGISKVEVDKEWHKFTSRDRSHRRTEDVYEMLYQMEWQLKFEGYTPDTSHVFRCLDEEEKVEELREHSQKLAIAFALVATPEGVPIRIVRNVRMCADCHAYTKLISAIFNRKIIVKDCYRFHHFCAGACSCKDYY